MSSGTTVHYWSYYVAAVGLSLSVVPGLTFDILGVDLEGEVWVRVLGIVLLLLATYYYAIGTSNARIAVVATVIGRPFAAVALTLLWLTGGPWQLVLFAAFDLAGAAWTWRALQSE